MAEESANFDPLVDQLPSRYVVGIDLGTTNSAVTYIDTQEDPWQIRVFDIPQLVAMGEVEPRDTLPSFHYQPAAAQVSGDALKLPWDKENADFCVGVMARDDGSKAVGRGIASAKSWLCHAGVDRTAALLPWHGAEDVEKLSPVEVSGRFLAHVRSAWNAQFKSERLEDQDLIITLPASFDEVARELTIQAAKQAKLTRVVLIEEPQAAFYAWVYKHQDDWQQKVDVGQKILICDIGGGTTDFTLIRVRASETDAGQVQFHRVAVGNHLILGGDNLDLALAKYIEQKLTGGKKLPPRQWDLLLGSSRQAKEQLLGDSPSDQVTISLPSGGSKLIGGLKTEVTRDEVCRLLVDGFLPACDVMDKPAQHSSGFQEFGLPYATDPGISRYLSSFLVSHQDDGLTEDQRAESERAGQGRALPDIVLFNGGFFASPVLRDEVLKLFDNWFGRQPEVLDNDRLDLAVARGASYYGMVRRGEGVKISASLARSYYIGIGASESDGVPQAVCLVPGSAQPGEEIELEQTFRLTISQPVEFSLLVSSVRLADQSGQILPVNAEEMTPLPPIRTVLRSKNRSETGEVAVRLRVLLSEIGTIDLSCYEVGSNRSWRLQFDVRSTTQTDVASHEAVGESQGFVDEETWAACHEVIADVFGPEGTAKQARLVKQLATVLGASRESWPMSTLRRIWEALIELDDGRRKSASHEARWLNLLGYALRPGYGLAVDDWRVAETWRRISGKLVHGSANIQTESLILWRRLSGGLSRGQQAAIAEPWISAVRGLHKRLCKQSTVATTLKPEESVEVWRLLGSLELLSVRVKTDLGQMILDLLDKKAMANSRDAMIWALGRLGARTPLYGPLNSVVAENTAWGWLEDLMRQPVSSASKLAIVQMSRFTDDRYRDLDERRREEVVEFLALSNVSEHLVKIVREGGEFSSDEQSEVFGESLPRGLRLG